MVSKLIIPTPPTMVFLPYITNVEVNGLSELLEHNTQLCDILTDILVTLIMSNEDEVSLFDIIENHENLLALRVDDFDTHMILLRFTRDIKDYITNSLDYSKLNYIEVHDITIENLVIVVNTRSYYE